MMFNILCIHYIRILIMRDVTTMLSFCILKPASETLEGKESSNVSFALFFGLAGGNL